MKKKNITQILCSLIQIAAFLLFPGLFVLVLYSIRGIYQALLQESFSLETQGRNLLTLLSVIPVTIFGGRFFCGALCAFGSMQELASFLAGKLHIRQIKPAHKTDRCLKLVKYAVLLFLLIAWTLELSLDELSPWYVFGVYSSADGTYTGSGSGRNGSIQVEVTVSDGAITAIDILSSMEDAPYLSRAIAVIDSVISTQSVEVSTVSGATMSSNGILEAIADALDLPFTNTNSQIRGGHGHGKH